jgi:Protein of unknown function (DUF4236)
VSLRFLRRVSILPGVRLNFSRSGVSTTIGIRGAHVTLGGRYGATANLGIPGSGLSLRVPLKSSQPTHGQSPSLPADIVPSAPTYPSVQAPALQKPAPQMTPIQSDAVGNITTSGLTALRELISNAMQQRREAEAAVSKATTLLAEWERALADAQQRRNRAEQRHAKLAASFFRRFRKGAIAAAQVEVEQRTREIEQAAGNVGKARAYKEATEHRRDELWVDTDLSLSGPAYAAWNRLAEAFTALSRSEGIWDVTAYREKRAGDERSVATKVIDRKPVQLTTAELPIIHTKQDALRWHNSNGGDLFIYPGFLIVFQDEHDFAMLDSNEVQCNFQPRRYEEWERAPSDSKHVGVAWRYSNRDGSPDRRYSNNPQMPVLLYAEVAWKSASGLAEEYLFSNAQAAATFVDALTDFRNALNGPSSAGGQKQAGDVNNDAIKQVLEKIEIHPNKFEQVPGTTTWNFNCDIRCRKCGGTVLSVPDNATDSSMTTCKSCGAEVGKYGDVKAAGREAGQEEMRRRGLM